MADPVPAKALNTFPQYLLRNASQYGSRPAMRHKDLGVWQSWTWSELRTQIQYFSLGLQQLGIKAGDKVAVVGSNRPRLYWSFAALQALGAVPVPVYAESVAEEMEYVLEHAEAKCAICQNQEQVDKIQSLLERLPNIKSLVYDEPRGLRDYDHESLQSITGTIENGRRMSEDAGTVEQWEASIAAGTGSELCVMLYTSGTTGRPKGVMLSNDNLLISSLNGNVFDQLDQTEQIIAYLPLAWVGDHVFSYGQFFTAGYCVCCPESASTIDVDRREIAPTYFFAPPRVFENLLTEIMVRMEDAGGFKRKLFKYFMDVADRCGEKILNGSAVSAKDRLLYALGNIAIYGPLRNRLGMSRIKVGYTAGEAIGPEIFRFYRSLGINLKQLYGQTEASVYITAQPDGEIYPDTVGKPSIDVELKVSDSGEVLYRSPGVFMGYFKNEEATESTKTADGWVLTGDAGFIDERGHLKIIDRAKDVGRLNDGSMFPPKYIENKLKFFPNIKEVVAFGDGRDFTTAFVNIDLTSVGNWAERNNIAYASYQELAGHPEVYKMIDEHVNQVNLDLSAEPMMAAAQIKRFLVLHKELDADDGELTRTQKVRRSFIAERYMPLIDGLYDGSTERDIATEVIFEDGRRGEISATVAIHDMQTYAPQPLQESA
ncbi:long-chain fatty acid--CoA ligase [Chromatiales bacterium (ex Bugula neritina AB1)]|nr:long-chain fatty acid--CoA ligase [Chromatiales bacterium (ex Bugula neritina AB1)]